MTTSRCKRGHDNWRINTQGRRVCKTCMSARKREWQERNEQADYQRGRRTAIAELRAWGIEEISSRGSIHYNRLLTKLDEMEKP